MDVFQASAYAQMAGMKPVRLSVAWSNLIRVSRLSVGSTPGTQIPMTCGESCTVFPGKGCQDKDNWRWSKEGKGRRV
jgi:hypothetical protein